MAVETYTTLHKRSNDVLTQNVIIIKSRTMVKCSSKETFESLISKFAIEFQEERVNMIVIVDFSVSKVSF